MENEKLMQGKTREHIEKTEALDVDLSDEALKSIVGGRSGYVEGESYDELKKKLEEGLDAALKAAGIL